MKYLFILLIFFIGCSEISQDIEPVVNSGYRIVAIPNNLEYPDTLVTWTFQPQKRIKDDWERYETTGQFTQGDYWYTFEIIEFMTYDSALHFIQWQINKPRRKVVWED